MVYLAGCDLGTSTSSHVHVSAASAQAAHHQQQARQARPWLENSALQVGGVNSVTDVRAATG